MSGYAAGILAQLLVNIVIAYSVFLPAAAGLLNLGAAGFVLIGAYCAGALTAKLGAPLLVAVGAGGLAAGAIAFLVAFPILRTRGVYMVLATFAFAEVVGGILLNIPALGGAAGLTVTAYAGLPMVAGVTAAVVLFVAWLLATRLGLAMRAVHDDENVALLFGANLRLVQVAAFTIGGALGGIGGALLVHQFNFIDVQSTGVVFSIFVLLYVLMGGTQTAWGPIAGALFFTLVPEFLRRIAEIAPALKFLEGGRYIVFGVAVVLVMMWRPEGLVTRTLLARKNMLELTDVSKSFGGLKVIDGVSFSVRAGSRTALIGPNGAGKTTLFNLVSGVYPIDSGTVRLEGEDITALPARMRIRRGLARSFQNVRLMPHLSTVENVMLGEHWRARPLALAQGRRAGEAARAALAAAGLDDYPGQVVSNLPYGVQKRIEVVRALAAKPKLLMLDEPAAGLNPAEAEALSKLLERASAEGITLLVVEHNMHFVRRLCDRVVVVNFGRKLFEGTPDEVHRDPAVREAYLGVAA